MWNYCKVFTCTPKYIFQRIKVGTLRNTYAFILTPMQFKITNMSINRWRDKHIGECVIQQISRVQRKEKRHGKVYTDVNTRSHISNPVYIYTQRSGIYTHRTHWWLRRGRGKGRQSPLKRCRRLFWRDEIV